VLLPKIESIGADEPARGPILVYGGVIVRGAEEHLRFSQPLIAHTNSGNKCSGACRVVNSEAAEREIPGLAWIKKDLRLP
jgi:hypothetical protein